jgi:F420-non-reducing hydrogenase iron-sulfur subunit
MTASNGSQSTGQEESSKHAACCNADVAPGDTAWNVDSSQSQIIAFCCNYCAYAAADLAGSLRLSYPPDIRVIHLPCTGRLDELEVLHAVERGADGILVAGCLEGDCHFQQGNLNARRRVEHIQGLLEQIGLARERIHMANLSSAMASEFARVATEFTEQIHQLGPNPLKSARQPEIEPMFETIGDTG